LATGLPKLLESARIFSSIITGGNLAYCLGNRAPPRVQKFTLALWGKINVARRPVHNEQSDQVGASIDREDEVAVRGTLDGSHALFSRL